jgi:hypothetical protein
MKKQSNDFLKVSVEEFEQLVRDIEVETQGQAQTIIPAGEEDQEPESLHPIDYPVKIARSALKLEEIQDKGVEAPEELYPTPPYGSPTYPAALLAAAYGSSKHIQPRIRP